MVRKTHFPITANHTIKSGAFIGIISSLAVSLIFITIVASLVTKGSIPEDFSSWTTHIVQAIAGLTGVLIGTGLTKEKYFATSGIIVGGYLFLLIGLGIALYDGSFQNFGVGIISVLIGGTVGCLIRLKSQKKTTRARKTKV